MFTTGPSITGRRSISDATPKRTPRPVVVEDARVISMARPGPLAEPAPRAERADAARNRAASSPPRRPSSARVIPARSPWRTWPGRPASAGRRSTGATRTCARSPPRCSTGTNRRCRRSCCAEHRRSGPERPPPSASRPSTGRWSTCSSGSGTCAQRRERQRPLHDGRLRLLEAHVRALLAEAVRPIPSSWSTRCSPRSPRSSTATSATGSGTRPAGSPTASARWRGRLLDPSSGETENP